MFYNKIVADLSELPNFINYYEAELHAAKGDIKIHGKVEKELSNLPGETEHRFNQLQEIEAVLEYLNIQLRKIRRKHFQKYLEAYQRALTSRDAEKYVDGEELIEIFGVFLSMRVLTPSASQFWAFFFGCVVKGFQSRSY